MAKIDGFPMSVFAIHREISLHWMWMVMLSYLSSISRFLFSLYIPCGVQRQSGTMTCSRSAPPSLTYLISSSQEIGSWICSLPPSGHCGTGLITSALASQPYPSTRCWILLGSAWLSTHPAYRLLRILNNTQQQRRLHLRPRVSKSILMEQHSSMMTLLD